MKQLIVFFGINHATDTPTLGTTYLMYALIASEKLVVLQNATRNVNVDKDVKDARMSTSSKYPVAKLSPNGQLEKLKRLKAENKSNRERLQQLRSKSSKCVKCAN